MAAGVARFVLDNSGLSRHRFAPVGEHVDALTARGLLATCGVVELEALYSARGPADYGVTAAQRRSQHEWLETEDVDLRRALEVQAALARDGRHRAVTLPDLVVAAVAERHRVTVLHYDADYDTIAAVTGQPGRVGRAPRDRPLSRAS